MPEIIWDFLNPLMWFSLFWIVFDVESFIILKKKRVSRLSSPLGLAFFLSFASVSVVVDWEMINLNYASEAIGWDFQFGYMPIPPGGADAKEGLTQPLEYVFLILYPVINRCLGFFGYHILKNGWHNLWKIRAIVNIKAIVGLVAGKIWFESGVLLHYYD